MLRGTTLLNVPNAVKDLWHLMWNTWQQRCLCRNHVLNAIVSAHALPDWLEVLILNTKRFGMKRKVSIKTEYHDSNSRHLTKRLWNNCKKHLFI